MIISFDQVYQVKDDMEGSGDFACVEVMHPSMPMECGSKIEGCELFGGTSH